jgi:hypothetical protein
MSRNNNMNAIMAGGFATGEAGMDAEDAEAATKKKTAYAYPWMAANRPTRNAPWEMTSLNSTERLEKAEAERKAAAYKPVHFWTKTSTDRAHEAERAMQAKEYTYTKPWDVHPDDADRAAEEELNRQMAAIAGVGAHETTCPWKTEEMTEKQKEQLAAYKYTTPYQVGDIDTPPHRLVSQYVLLIPSSPSSSSSSCCRADRVQRADQPAQGGETADPRASCVDSQAVGLREPAGAAGGQVLRAGESYLSVGRPRNCHRRVGPGHYTLWRPYFGRLAVPTQAARRHRPPLALAQVPHHGRRQRRRLEHGRIHQGEG